MEDSRRVMIGRGRTYSYLLFALLWGCCGIDQLLFNIREIDGGVFTLARSYSVGKWRIWEINLRANILICCFVVEGWRVACMGQEFLGKG